MTTLARLRTNPLAEMLRWMETEDMLGPGGLGLSSAIRVEDFVDEGTYTLRAEMPGIDPDNDVTITVDGDILTIKGERKEEKKEKGRSEFRYGSFARSIALPRHAKTDEIAATYVDGVLEVVVPVDAEAVEPHHIAVRRPDESGAS